MLTEEQFKDDEGIKIIDEFAHLQEQKKEIEQRLLGIKERLISFAMQKQINQVCGSNKKASIKPYLKIVYPKDKEKLIKMIKEKGLYEELSSVNYFKLSPRILRGDMDNEITELTKKEEAYRINLSDR